MDSFRTIAHELLFAQGSSLGPGYVAARAVIIFVIAIFYVRLARKRFMAQGSAMDLVMVVIFGSTLSRGINGGGSLISSLLAGILLVGLQRVLSHFSARSHAFGRIVKGSKEVLVRNGQIDWDQMRYHDITEHDLHQEMRIRATTDDINQIELAVLERSGQIGFVKRAPSSS